MAGFELIDDEERHAVDAVMRSTVLFAHGFDGMRNGVFKVREFEQEFAAKMGSPWAQAVSSGTAALLVGLKALGVGPGDEVITQSHTFVATVEAILAAGASPVIAEVDDTLNLDTAALESLITARTRAIIPVHMLGVAADMASIMRIAERHKLAVLEDTAQAVGASFRGRRLGTFGDAAAFSFDHGKALTTGEGGMVLARTEAVYRRARSFHDHGHAYDPSVSRADDPASGFGFNYRMSEIQAAIGIVQLAKLDRGIARQRANKARIKEALSRFNSIRFRRLPDPDGDAGDCLVFMLPDSAATTELAARLAAKGIGTKNLPSAINWHFAGRWDHIVPRMPLYQGRKASELLPRSADWLGRSIALPIMVKMDEAAIGRVVDIVGSELTRMRM